MGKIDENISNNSTSTQIWIFSKYKDLSADLQVLIQ
jgi:hypothetical protein